MSRLTVLAALGTEVTIGNTIVTASPLTMRGYAELQIKLCKHIPGAQIHDTAGRQALFEHAELQKQLLVLCLRKHHPEIEGPEVVAELWEVMIPSQFAELVGVAFRGPRGAASPTPVGSDHAARTTE